MAKQDWNRLQQQFLSAHAATGISPKDWCKAQGLNYASAKRYIKIANGGANSQKKTANSQKAVSLNRRHDAASGADCAVSPCAISPETKLIRGSRFAPPVNPFGPGNQYALKHGGYGRRMLLSDATTEDARLLTLDDELFCLRAANLTAAENIGRWQAELELADAGKKQELYSLISAAQKAMHRNTARIESLEYTRCAMAKLRADTAYRAVATQKAALEVSQMKDGDKDNAIVVHNALPVPGR